MTESRGETGGGRTTLDAMQEKLRELGIEVDLTGDVETCCSSEGKVKMVCVGPGLSDSVREMSESPRDQVVMVRVDEATSEAIDAWVETGAVKSRSEAARCSSVRDSRFAPTSSSDCAVRSERSRRRRNACDDRRARSSVAVRTSPIPIEEGHHDGERMPTLSTRSSPSPPDFVGFLCRGSDPFAAPRPAAPRRARGGGEAPACTSSQVVTAGRGRAVRVGGGAELRAGR